MPSEDRHDTSKSWCTVEDGYRTIEEIQCLCQKKKTDLKFGCIQQPLFPSIPIDHVIPDILHLFLRISDTLTNLLILDLRRMDGMTGNEFKQQAAKNVNMYITYLNESCKIPFHMYMGKESKTLKWRDLTGPEKLKLFKSIKIPELFPKLKKGKDIQALWNGLSSIYKLLWSTKKMDENEIQIFSKDVKAWMTQFTSIYQTKHVCTF